MSIGHRSIAGRIVRSSLVTVLAAVLTCALVGPVLAVSGPTKLSDPSVSPTGATPSDVIAFAVTYRNREGSPPDEVRVVIDGVAHVMSYPAGDEAWKRGVRFSFATALPLGTHTVVFSATDREKFTDEIDGGSVTVALPPTPPLTPAPTAAPTPAPTAAPSGVPTPTTAPGSVLPTPTPTAAGGATAPGGGPQVPSGSPSPGSSVGAGDDLAPRPAGASAAGGTGSSGADDRTPGGGAPDDPDVAGPEDDGSPSAPGGPGLPGAPDQPGGGDAGVGPGGSDAGSDGLANDGWGSLARTLEALGVEADRSGLLQVLPTLVGSTGGVALAMAFMFFGKKRRDGDPPAPDEVLHASAARGTALPSTATLVPSGAGPADVEMLMPRWRRPSLLQARKADPLRDTGPTRAALSFDHGLVGPVDGYERRIIRYTAVRLLDAPDELRSAEIGFLDQGDEVQLLERSGAYWLVLCPDGGRGWLHKMTLGDVVGERPAPGPRETWATETVDPATGIDDDVLSAFLAARGRA